MRYGQFYWTGCYFPKTKRCLQIKMLHLNFEYAQNCPSGVSSVGCSSGQILVQSFDHPREANLALYNDQLVNQCVARSGSPRNDKSSH